MMEQLGPGLRLTLIFTLLTGLLYPAVLTPLCQLLFPAQANGSLMSVNGRVVGSSLIGQTFTRPEYFHSRPSSAGNGYDAGASSGSNLGPTSAKLLQGTTKVDKLKKESVDFDGVRLRIVHYSIDNGIPYESSIPLDRFRDAQGNLDDVRLIDAFNRTPAPLVFTPKAPIPADAVTASASGLDPHISPESAAIQMTRVAQVRGVSVGLVRQLVDAQTRGSDWGLFGEPRVNVLELNLALDEKLPMH
jgi:K+-transporting ATPase ATPase C chain